MQYKIPVQIENEDKIFLNLSLRQIIILMIWFSIAYTLFKWLEKSAWGAIALFPTGIILFISLFIALFRNSEMTFVPFCLNLIRLQWNTRLRVWGKWIDSYSKVEIWYVPKDDYIKSKVIKTEVKQIHEDILSKI